MDRAETDDTALSRLHAFVDVPASSVEPAETFWAAALGWPPGERWAAHPEFVSLVPPAGEAYAHVQQVDDAPRVHVDLEVGDLDAARDRAASLGAGTGTRTSDWQVMSSPGGLPFCLCRESRGGTRPPPTRWPDGHRSRLVQVCLDVPDESYDRELAFWGDLTGWSPETTRRAEYVRLRGPGTGPLQLLVQRLGADDAGATTRAHLDLGTDDVDAETARVQALGARYVERVLDWVVLVDPVGLPFCVTAKSPE